MKIIFLTLFCLLFQPSFVLANDGFEALEERVDKFRNFQSVLVLNNGRSYQLEGNLLLEELNVSRSLIKRNVFDFDNEIIAHEFKSTSEKECPKNITPFSEISTRRVEEVIEIGCFIYSKDGRLTKRNDDLDDFNTRFCGKYKK